MLLSGVTIIHNDGDSTLRTEYDGKYLYAYSDDKLEFKNKDTYGKYNSKTNTRIIKHHDGGVVDFAIILIEIANSRNEKVVLECRPGCASAATLWLGANNACIFPDSRFVFHRPTNDWLGFSRASVYWVKRMGNFYPPNLRTKFFTEITGVGMDTVTISGTKLKQLDPNYIKFCEPDPAAPKRIPAEFSPIRIWFIIPACHADETG